MSPIVYFGDMINKNYYKTSSLATAAAIQAASTAPLEFIDFTNPKRAEFVFDRTKDPSFNDIVSRFWSRTLPIDAATYFDALRSIKSRLYEEKNARP